MAAWQALTCLESRWPGGGLLRPFLLPFGLLGEHLLQVSVEAQLFLVVLLGNVEPTLICVLFPCVSSC